MQFQKPPIALTRNVTLLLLATTEIIAPDPLKLAKLLRPVGKHEQVTRNRHIVAASQGF